VALDDRRPGSWSRAAAAAVFARTGTDAGQPQPLFAANLPSKGDALHWIPAALALATPFLPRILARPAEIEGEAIGQPVYLHAPHHAGHNDPAATRPVTALRPALAGQVRLG